MVPLCGRAPFFYLSLNQRQCLIKGTKVALLLQKDTISTFFAAKPVPFFQRGHHFHEKRCPFDGGTLPKGSPMALFWLLFFCQCMLEILRMHILIFPDMYFYAQLNWCNNYVCRLCHCMVYMKQYPIRVFSRFYHILITFGPGTMSREVTSKKNTQSAHCMHV